MAIQVDPPIVATIGDSLTVEYRDANKFAGMARSMGSMANGTFLSFDISVGGLTAEGVRYNTGSWNQGAPFAAVAGAVPVKYYLFRLGGVEAIQRTPNLSGYVYDLPSVKENLRALVAATRAAGRKPVLCSYPTLPLSPNQNEELAYTPATLARIDLVHAYMGDLASEENVPVIDVRTSVLTVSDLLDNVHPNEVASHRVGKEIGTQFRNLITWY